MKVNRFVSIASLLLTIIASIYLSWNFRSINLGLDLRGGVHLTLEIDMDDYLNQKYSSLGKALKEKLRKIGYRNFSTASSGIKFFPRDQNSLDKIKKIIHLYDSNLIISHREGSIYVSYPIETIEQSIEVVRTRIDSQGTLEPIIQRQGEKNISLQVPGSEDPESLKRILGSTAKLSIHLVSEKYEDSEQIEVVDSYSGRSVIVDEIPVITGDMINDARTNFDNYSLPAVSFSLNIDGSKNFAEVTKKYPGRKLAIILDNKLISAPTINEPILSGNGSISGSFTIDTANELALMLRAGALPAAIKVIEERTVGPSLGSDAIDAGKVAGMVGIAGVMVCMIWLYGFMGIISNIVLLITMIYIFSILLIFDATLTLPGIAGLILTIGMAVDANVLIYERIREELSSGASTTSSLEKGFKNAFATILDSNITTLLAALFLYIFGVSVIKGFAVALSAGVISSMFASIVITKVVIFYTQKILNLNFVINQLK
jgi:preprotein translocase subunit SecD